MLQAPLTARHSRKGRAVARKKRPGVAAKAEPSAERPVPHADPGDFSIVGVGASAGGLEAFTALFKALPADTGMAFVLVPHLAPSHASALTDIMARTTSMPVSEVVDAVRVESNHVYVIPPGWDMVIVQGALHLHNRSSGAHHRPIDQFLRSLAADQKHQAIGVILSGTATDGTVGLSAIKAEGGITFAQDDSAQQTGMPHSAIAEGSVDFVLPPHEIARELTRISQHPRLALDLVSSGSDGHADVGTVLEAIRQGTGVDFTNYKATTLHRRIARRMILRKTTALQEYAQVLRRTPSEVEALYNDLLIGVTSFFRNPEAFETLKTSIFPRFLKEDRARNPLRMWVLGCSTGQEAYSLAMAFAEVAEASARQVPVQIFATDLNAAAIETARTGMYPKDLVNDVSPERLRRFFTPVDDHFRIAKTIRDMCVFSRHNVLDDPPFSQIDFISCRNLLIYLEPVLQQQVIPVLHYALKPHGVLWLGTAETTGSQKEHFEIEDAKYKIFTKKAGVISRASSFSLPRRRVQPEPSPPFLEPRDGADVLKESDRLLLSRFAPAGVLVSPAMEILQYRGDIGPYMSPVPGRASLNLLKMLGHGLQVAVRAAVLRAKRDETSVRQDAVRIQTSDGGVRNVAIEVIPVKAGKGFLVLFEESNAGRSTPAETTRSKRKPARQDTADQQVGRLSKELADTRDYLQSVIEQQEAAHEELQSAHEEVQSANEELQSINEELETSKEEIQSTNEELSTVNDELQDRNAELNRTIGDLSNFMASTNQAVVFVGRDLRIRRYTPAAESMLNVTAADVGRPIRETRFKITLPELESILGDAINAMSVTERDIQDDQGRWYSLRVRPYRTLDDQIDGATFVLVDVDVLVRARLYAESIFATVREPLIVLDADMRVVTANTAFFRTFRVDPEHTTGRRLYELGSGQWDIPALRQLLEEILPLNHQLGDFEVVRDFEGVGRKAMMLNARRLDQLDLTEEPLILLAIEDVSERRHAEGLRRERIAELASADRSKTEFLAMLAHELRNPLAPIRAATQLLGLPGVAPAATEKARVIIDRQIQNMTRLIDDLLDVSRITQGKIDLRTAPIDLTAILGRAVELVQHHLDEREQVLSVDLPSEPAHVLGDAARLEQAFGNLLNNASKFTPRAGHIWLSATIAEAQDGRRELVVRVRDEGVGVVPEALPTIFELFKQVGHSPHHVPGLGVGLALVQRIAALHGGTVAAHSAGLDQGSEFIVSLPVLRDALPDTVEETDLNASPADGASRRILIVDDNIDAAESLAALLSLRKHDVRVVHDGHAALQTAIAFLPEIVFLDIAMPGMNGYDVARRLRQLSGLESAFLVAVTGFGRDEDRQLAREAGFDQHLTKPLDPMALPGVLARVGDGR